MIRERSINFVHNIIYDVTTDDRFALSETLLNIAKMVFAISLKNHNSLAHQKMYLLEAFELIGKDHPNTIIYRAEAINEQLVVAIDLLNTLWVDGNDSFSSDRKLLKATRKFIEKLNKLTNRSLKPEQHDMLATSPPGPTMITLWTSHLEKSLVKCLHQIHPNMFEFVKDEQTLKAEAEKAAEEKEIELIRWLKLASPDVLDSYRQTQQTLSEAASIMDNAEDEYFIEQVKTDYYPQIFTTVKNCDDNDFHNKQVIVEEAVKQLKIIQLGLQKVIDGTANRQAKNFLSQTNFLRSKVLGNQSLSLTSQEADELVDISVEEINRTREEFYKRHVAPVLEKNKQDYEEAIHAKGTEFEEALAMQEAEFQAKIQELAKQAAEKVATANQELELLKSQRDTEAVRTQERLLRVSRRTATNPENKTKSEKIIENFRSKISAEKEILKQMTSDLKEQKESIGNDYYSLTGTERSRNLFEQYSEQNSRVTLQRDKVDYLVRMFQQKYPSASLSEDQKPFEGRLRIL